MGFTLPKILRKPVVKAILSALAIAFFGMILLNMAFLFAALFQGAINAIVGLFVPLGPDMTLYWYPPLRHGLFLVLLLAISWLILRSKLGEVFKATYMIVPLAAVYVTLGIFTYQVPALAYALGSIIFLGALYYIYRTKQSWLFYYSLCLISLTMLLVVILGVEI